MTALPSRCSLLALCVYLLLQADAAFGGDLAAYGAKLCEDAGIPRDQCTLAPGKTGLVSTGSPALGATDKAAHGAGKGPKADTLEQHARQLCAKQGVKAENCLAMPKELRQSDNAQASLIDATAALDPPLPARAPVRHGAPPAYRFVAAEPVDQQPAAELLPPSSRSSGDMDERALLPEPPLANASPMPEPIPAAVRLPSPRRDRLTRTIRHDDPMPDRRQFEQETRAERDGGFDTVRDQREPRFDRFADSPQEEDRTISRLHGKRCFRSIRYSAPPSHRFVACNELN